MLEFLLWRILPVLTSGDGGPPPSFPPRPEIALWPQVTKVLITLLLMMGILLLLAVLWRKFLPRFQPQSAAIRILASHYLGPKQAIFLIAVGEETFLVASSASHLSLVPLMSPKKSDGGELKVLTSGLKT